ncbi:MAG: hypothetical protein ACJAVK_001093 [Akkermansiaceae bacterium]|jgi:hypothetical protein
MKTTSVIVGGLVVLWVFLFRMPDQTVSQGDAKPLAELKETPGSRTEVLVLHDAPFALNFGKGEVSAEQELALIQLAFQDYLSFVKVGQRGPIGDNRDFVKKLTGGNVQRVAPIPPGHPRINVRQELTDRFGIPFAIHPLSSGVIEVRAAGPDKLLWTPDDQVSLTASGKALKDQLLGE